jgi:hypothetical protein
MHIVIESILPLTDGPSGQQGVHHHTKPEASKKHKKCAWGTHLNMEINVGIRRTQSVAICCNVTHFGVTRKRR